MPADMQYPSGAWLGLDIRLLLAPEEQFSLFTPAQRECVSDYVNEQRLALFLSIAATSHSLPLLFRW